MVCPSVLQICFQCQQFFLFIFIIQICHGLDVHVIYNMIIASSFSVKTGIFFGIVTHSMEILCHKPNMFCINYWHYLFSINCLLIIILLYFKIERYIKLAIGLLPVVEASWTLTCLFVMPMPQMTSNRMYTLIWAKSRAFAYRAWEGRWRSGKYKSLTVNILLPAFQPIILWTILVWET